MPSLSVTLLNRRSEIERLHDAIETFGQGHGVPDRVLFAVNLALDEIVTNIIVHGFTDRAEHHIRVEVSLDAERLEATVRDDAPPFDPLSVRPVDLDAPAAGRPIGGLGVHLARSVADGMDYRRDGAENVVVIRKRLGAPDSESSES